MTMKNITSIFYIALTAILTHTTSYGSNFSGSDDFNDNSKDLAKWGTDTIFDPGVGSGTLTETSQVLQYTAAGSSSNEQLARPWIANTGSFTSDWSLQLDVNVPTLSLSAGQRIEFGLGVTNGDDPTDSFRLSLRLDAASGRQFHSQLRVDGVGQTAVNSTTTSTSAAILIQYDAATTTLSAGYDADGAVGGYNFTIFDSRNITSWNMTASSVFGVAVGGSSEGSLAISSANNVNGDNFLAVPEPSTYALLLSGMGIVAYKRFRRNRA